MKIEPNNIYCMDNLEGMYLMDDESVDVCITSPPYNLGNKKVKYKTHDDSMTFDEYMHFLRIRFEELYHIMKSDGRVIINIGDKKNGKDPTHYYIMKMMEKIGYHFYVNIIWDKNNIRNRTAWGSFMKASCPSFPTRHEYIMVFYKERIKKLNKGISTIEKQNFIDWSIPIWTFPPETGMKKKWNHQAVFPEELPHRCIQLFSYQDDLILDIFSGVGTTCAVAKKHNRQYIGFENNVEDVDKSNERLYNVRTIDRKEA